MPVSPPGYQLVTAHDDGHSWYIVLGFGFTMRARSLASQDALSTTETLRLVVDDGSIERAVRLSVFGMAKSACASTVELGLKNLPGVMSAKVSLLTETADVRFDESSRHRLFPAAEHERADQPLERLLARLAVGDRERRECSRLELGWRRPRRLGEPPHIGVHLERSR